MSEDILILDRRVVADELRRLVAAPFGDMVKFVADVERGVIAVGGELHADAERVLLDSGSRSEHLWGGNYFPGRGREECLEYTSFINIRPARGNSGMEIEGEDVRRRVREIVFALLGEGEALA